MTAVIALCSGATSEAHWTGFINSWSKMSCWGPKHLVFCLDSAPELLQAGTSAVIGQTMKLQVNWRLFVIWSQHSWTREEQISFNFPLKAVKHFNTTWIPELLLFLSFVIFWKIQNSYFGKGLQWWLHWEIHSLINQLFLLFFCSNCRNVSSPI